MSVLAGWGMDWGVGWQIRCKSTDMSKGLGIKCWAPRAEASARIWGLVKEGVTIKSGHFSGNAAIWRSAARPSNLAKTVSVTTTSGWSCCTKATSSSPLPARPITWTRGSSSSWPAKRLRNSTLSSAIITVVLLFMFTLSSVFYQE